MAQTTLPESSGKLNIRGEYILGAAGDVRAINLLHHIFKPPAIPANASGEKLDQHLTQKVIPAIRKCFDEHGYSPPDKQDRDHQAEQASTILISIRSRVYIIEPDYSWAHDNLGIYTIGTGYQYSRAALHMLIGEDITKLTMKQAVEHVRTAIDVTAAHDPYTGPPYRIFTQTPKSQIRRL